MLLHYYGLQTIRTEQISSKIKSCILPNYKLRYVELKGFPSLEYLDLSKNNLKDVNGLENLKRFVPYLVPPPLPKISRLNFFFL